MLEHKLIKVEDNDPYRCQGVTKYGQCQFQAYENKKYCLIHGGNITNNVDKEKNLRNYRFTKYQARINEFADNDQVKSLREEIGILRIVMEETVNKCHDTNDLLMYSSKITELTLKIEKLVSSCHKLETSLGETLNKTSILNISTRIVNIVSKYVPSDEIIDSIVEEIGQLVKES